MRDTAAAYDRYRSVSFFGALDGLRCLCVMAVLWHHSPLHDQMEGAAQIFFRGFVGVNFFFVLSGFLITTLLLREEARKGFFSISGFYWRRALRIIPVYFLIVTLAAVYWIGVKGEAGYLPKLPYYYLFLSNVLIGDLPLLQPTWSLSVEEQYYLIWPALLLFLPIKGSMRPAVLITLITICVLSAAGNLAFLGLRPIETEHAVWTFSVTGYSAILIGSLLAVILHNPKGFAICYRAFGFVWMPVLAFVALAVVLNETPGVLRGWPDFLMHLTMALCLMTLVLREDHALMPVLKARPIARIGQISYGLYLYHLIGLHFGNEIGSRLGLNGMAELWAISGIYLVVSLLIAEISFRTFERYFLLLKDRRRPVVPA